MKIKDARPHTDMSRPVEYLQLPIKWLPDVQDIRSKQRQISTNTCSGDHMAHPECTHSVQRSLTSFSERYRIALPYLLDPDQGLFRECFCVLNFFHKFFSSAEHSKW